MLATLRKGPLRAPDLGGRVSPLLEGTRKVEGLRLNRSTGLRVNHDIIEEVDSARIMASSSTPSMDGVSYVLHHAYSSEDKEGRASACQNCF